MEYSNAANNDIETIRSPYTINENVGRANTRGDIMIINGNGERKRVKLEEYNKSQQIDEDKTSLSVFEYDLAWDLSHGFTEAGQAFENIEKVK